MSSPAISIVVPAYNAGEWIGQTLESVQRLRFPPEALELVLIDDGSQDATRKIVQDSLQASRFRWTLHSQENCGPASARNLGWQSATGDWIQFLDADDLLMPEKLHIQWPVAASAEPRVAVVYSAWTYHTQVDGQWVTSSSTYMPRVGEDPVRELLAPNNFIATGSQLIRRDWLSKVSGFNEACDQIEDVDLALRLAMAGGAFLPIPSTRPLFLYRRRADSLSQRNGLRFIEGCVRNARMVELFWSHRCASLDEQKRRALLNVYGQALRYYFEHDLARFDSLLSHVDALANPYHPEGGAIGVLSRLVGYRAAERMALTYRRLKRQILGRIS